MINTINISSWNLCLGLFHKKEYVKTILHEKKIDILNLQETELQKGMTDKIMNLPGYTIETEINSHIRRVATYIKTGIKYKRRNDLEMKNGHMIIIDIGKTNPVRLVNLYRPFHPKNMSEFLFFNEQLKALDNLITKSTIVLGDFNLDLNKEHSENYAKKSYLTNMNNILGHHNLEQMVMEDTWTRTINNVITSSRLDHVYTTESSKINNLKLTDNAYSDHQMLTFDIKTEKANPHIRPVAKRSWNRYSKEALIDAIKAENWDIDCTDAQSFYNIYENKLVNIVDKLIPYKEINQINIKEDNPQLRRLINQKRSKMRKWKRTKRKEDLLDVKAMNVKIRNMIYNTRRDKIRRGIIPSNTKSLWDAVKMAKEEEISPIPNEMTLGMKNYYGDQIPEAFAQHFTDKVATIRETCKSDDEVYNGTRLMTINSENFFEETKVKICMMGLKIKNCEGHDRIPLRILNDGAEFLYKPITKLLKLIYTTKSIPEQWRIAKVIPTHKKGTKDNIYNYRPISNLCTTSKIYEKLILEQMLTLAKYNNIDLTGENQHGYKSERSTVTAAATIQSNIAKALDSDNYYILSSLDLSAAFDVVERSLLIKRMQIIGLPEDIICLTKDWLNDRKYYVETNGDCSSLHSSDHGTIQGSVLGPVLFSIFVRPLFDLFDIVNYADDNYIGNENENLATAMLNVKLKTEGICDWLSNSGLKINEEKTEICIFHRRNVMCKTFTIKNSTIVSKNTINILGLIFDSKLRWHEQVDHAIKSSNTNLYAIKVIRKYFNQDELKTMLTGMYFSKLYYGAEVWLIPSLTLQLKKNLKFASANALRVCLPHRTIFNTHTEIHTMAERALPEQMCLYKHAITLYKLFKSQCPENDFISLNFQLIDNPRSTKLAFTKRLNYEVGKNILLNRMYELNNKIEKSWLNLGIDSYKIKCKFLFLLT